MAEDKEDVLQRHRKETKELQVKCAAMKKSAPVSDKKRRKEVLAEIEALEKALEEKHQNELAVLEAAEGNAVAENPVENVSDGLGSLSVAEAAHEASETTEEDPGGSQRKMTRAQRRKLNKESRQAEFRLPVEEEDADYVSPRMIEKLKLKKILDDLELSLIDMPSDGNCLYSSLSHQLRLHGHDRNVKELRQVAAKFIRGRPDDFLPFLHHDSGDNFTSSDFEKYCDDLERTSAWGSQLELRALATVLEKPIRVLQAEGPHVLIGEEFVGDGVNPLVVVYHRHELSLGEHYNSVAPRTEKDLND